MSRRYSYAGMHQQSAAPQSTTAAPTGASESTASKKSHLFENLRNTMYQRSLEVLSQRQPSRRTSRGNDNAVTPDIDCSQQSILNAMDRFVKAVNNMDSTVLVPSRLKDMDVEGRVSPPPNMHVEDLHAFFTVLNDVKNELLWGPDPGNGIQILSSSPFNSALRVPSVSTRSTHKRQPSNGSLGSTASDLETDNDSVSDYADVPEPSTQLATAFRVHLQGLHTILHQLADSADYLAARYQEEVEPSQ